MVAMSLLRPAFGPCARAVLLRGSVVAGRNQLASPPATTGLLHNFFRFIRACLLFDRENIFTLEQLQWSKMVLTLVLTGNRIESMTEDRRRRSRITLRYCINRLATCPLVTSFYFPFSGVFLFCFGVFVVLICLFLFVVWFRFFGGLFFFFWVFFFFLGGGHFTGKIETMFVVELVVVLVWILRWLRSWRSSKRGDEHLLELLQIRWLHWHYFNHYYYH